MLAPIPQPSQSSWSNERLRLLLVAPAAASCEPLEALLASSPLVTLAGRTDSESHALQLFFLLRPDLTVLDWRVAAEEPARFIGLLRRVVHDARIVSVVPDADSMPARAARALGADAVVTDAELPELLAALARDPQTFAGRLG
jgi:DNA-binding NarL/FixJ family response regulator